MRSFIEYGKLYERQLSEVGIKQIAPDEFQQAKIGKMINNLVINRHDNNDRRELLKVIDSFRIEL